MQKVRDEEPIDVDEKQDALLRQVRRFSLSHGRLDHANDIQRAPAASRASHRCLALCCIFEQAAYEVISRRTFGDVNNSKLQAFPRSHLLARRLQRIPHNASRVPAAFVVIGPREALPVAIPPWSHGGTKARERDRTAL
jgi:hypothetical protein